MKKRIALALFILLMLTVALVACGKDEHVCAFVKDEALSTNPTCTEDGVLVQKCSCGKSNTSIVPMIPHEYESVVVEATCTDDGKTSNVCKLCNKEEPGKTQTIEALGHDYQPDPEKNKLPTCTEAGYDATKCSRCGDQRRTNQVDALGHTWKTDFKWKDGIEPDCQTAATGWSYQYCEVCSVENKEFKSETKDVKVGDYECEYGEPQIIEATCQNEGVEVYSCKVCQQPKIVKIEDKKSCDFSQPGTVITAETCYNDRIELRTCAYTKHTVNNTREEEIPGTRLAHTPNVNNADCATDKYCKVCAEHFLGSATAVPTTDNYFAECPNKDDANCAFCTEEGKVHLFAPATGAHAGGVTRVVAATCMQTGMNYHTCTNLIKDGTATCGVEFNSDDDIIPIDTNAHKYNDTAFDQDNGSDKIYPATCTTYAYKAKTCENCDLEGNRCDSQITEVTPDLVAEGYAPHTFTNAEHTGTIICENPKCKLALYDSTYSKDVIYDTTKEDENAVEDFGDGSSLTVTITGTKTEVDGSGNIIDTHIKLTKAEATVTKTATAGANGVINNVVVIYIEKTGDITVAVEVNGVAYEVDENGYVHLNAVEIDVTSIELTATTDSDTASAKVYLYSSSIINN